MLPLYYGDEPWCWLLSRNLAWGYYEHPPAIAALIRAGTAIFGDTAFGIRFFGLLLSVPATFCVWRTASLLLDGKQDGARAALFFNLTPMTTIYTTLATQNAPELAFGAAFIWVIAEIAVTGRPWLWGAAGLTAGLGLLSKYTIVFLGIGVFLWLCSTKELRIWLKTPWPWLGASIAALVLLPNLIWVANDNWNTFTYQFGRAVDISVQWWWLHLPEFLIEQLLFASPFILFLAIRGLWCATTRANQKLFLIAALLWPTIVFFTLHALHSRVQRSWLSFVYPALAVAAALGYRRSKNFKLIRAAAVPAGVLLLAVLYVGVLFRPIPLGNTGLLLQDNAELAAPIYREVSRIGAQGILTLDYRAAAWLRYYLPETVPIIVANKDHLFSFAPAVTTKDLEGVLLGVILHDAPPDEAEWYMRYWFPSVAPIATAPTSDGRAGSPFLLYALSGFSGQPFGRRL
jgi:4-amino-4-deoxy-L-arabinose transferase-like glycosyltransferase